MDREKKQELLSILKEKMLKDENLPLRKGATNLVFGEGSPDAEFVFVGEGPGHWEDQKARPFVGNAGVLLNQLLLLAKLKREDVFITNVVHFRPPQNRDPLPEEIAAFQPYLDKIIEIIDPKIIVTLGRFSMAKFLPGTKISSVHGKERVVNWKGKNIVVVPMYHPAAGLRNGEIKLKLVEDFKKLSDIFKNIEKELQEKAEEDSVKQMELV